MCPPRREGAKARAPERNRDASLGSLATDLLSAQAAEGDNGLPQRTRANPDEHFENNSLLDDEHSARLIATHGESEDEPESWKKAVEKKQIGLTGYRRVLEVLAMRNLTATVAGW